MAITTISYNGFNNGDARLDIRNKINDLGNRTANLSVETSAEIGGINDSISVLDGRVDSLEQSTQPSAISILSTGKPTQTLVANTAEKLEWMDSVLVDLGTDISYTVSSNDILINTAGVYRVSGVMSLTAPVNDIVEIELYIDNLPTGLKASGIGRGADSVINFQNSFLTSFAINDDVHLYVKSTGTEITLSSGTMSIEKTEY